MDPVSQGVLGGSFAASGAKRSSELRPALVAGAVGGMLPDLDVLIRSDTDPLLFLEYHRQFSHALIFIPVGGAVAALVLWPLLRRYLSPRRLYAYATAGYATHALLDACTSYGTQLYWPFSHARIAWNVVSVIDPLYTLPFALLFGLAAALRKRRLAILGLAISVAYLLFGAVQHQRAEHAARKLAATRGHQPDRLTVKPGFANLWVWKSIYEAQDRYFVDGLYLGGSARYFPGESVPKLDIARDLPWLRRDSQHARDLERFRWFSGDYLAVDERLPHAVGDIRYSMLPHHVAPLWVIRFDPEGQSTHVGFENVRRDTEAAVNQLWDQLAGRGSLPLDAAPVSKRRH